MLWLKTAVSNDQTLMLFYFLKQYPVFCFSSFRDSSKKWQEKAELLTRLESQVKRMKENFDSKERLLLEERDKATEAHKYATASEESKSLFNSSQLLF